MTKRLIPFRLMPASIGLKGAAYDEADAHYNLEGEALQRRLAEIRLADDPKALVIRMLDLDKAHYKVDDYTYAIRMNELQIEDLVQRSVSQIDIDTIYHKIKPYDADLKKIALLHPDPKTDEEILNHQLAILDIEFKHGNIEKNAYEKRRATLKNEPWVAFVDSGFDPDEGLDSFRIELDWNTQWIDFLKLHGFVGHSEEQVVEDWFVEVCRSNAAVVEPSVAVLNSPYPMGFNDDDL